MGFIMFIEVPASKKSIGHRKTVYGVGINDAHYRVRTITNGEFDICPFYKTWHSMLVRVYSEKFKTKSPTYKGCTISEDWHVFSKFKEWMIDQDWHDKSLDKDILFSRNKHYSPDTCMFVPHIVNTILLGRERDRGPYPIGVTYRNRGGIFEVRCGDGAGGRIHLGQFKNVADAYRCYCEGKANVVRDVARLQDIRIMVALLRIASEIESGEYYDPDNIHGLRWDGV